MRPQYTILAAPASEPVTASQMMAHSRVDSEDDLATLEALISVAREYVDAVTGRVSVAHTFRLTAATWPDLLEGEPSTARIYRAPLVSVQSVSYYAPGSSTLTVMDAAAYRVVTGYEPGMIQFLGTLPVLDDRPDAIRIDITAGHSPAPPAMHRHAVKLLTAHLYEQRTPLAFSSVADLPYSLTTLIQAQKIAGWSA